MSEFERFGERIMKRFDTMSEEMKNNSLKLDSMQEKLDSIDSLKDSIAEVVKNYADLKESIQNVKVKLNHDVAVVQEVVNKHNTELAKLSAVAHSNQLQMLKVPTLPHENLTDVYKKICCAIGIAQPPNLVSIFRIPTKAQSKTPSNSNGIIIIKFATCWDRNAVFDSYLRNSEKCSTTALGFKSNSRIYFSEYLHPSMRPIFNLAQTMKSQSLFHRVRIREGLVYIQQKDKSNFVLVESINDLKTLPIKPTSTITNPVDDSIDEQLTTPSQINKPTKDGLLEIQPERRFTRSTSSSSNYTS